MRFRLLTLFASFLLLLIFAAITALVWRDREKELEFQLDQEANRLETAFDVAVVNLEQQMLALASLLGADPEIQRLFERGRAAVLAEGGGPGQALAAEARAELLARVAPQWQYMQQQFGVRQLQFHLGPGVLSFLRVHLPKRFGDRMDGLRYIIEDTNRDQRPRSGFETGRVQSGLRGVVPVFIGDAQGGGRFIGALEAGTAFDAQLGRLDRQLGAGFAILLDPRHVEASVWREYRKGRNRDSDAYLEASSRPGLDRWLDQTRLPAYSGQSSNWLQTLRGQTQQFIRFPLHDYLSKHDSARPPVGSVLVWRDVSGLVERQRQARWTLAGEALAGYAIAQILLLWLMRDTRHRWQTEVQRQADELRQAEARFQPLLMGLGEGVYGVDMDGRTTFINPAALRLLGLKVEEVLGRDQHALFHHHYGDGRRYPHAACPIHLTLVDGQARHEEEEWFWRVDGDGFPVALTATPVLENGVQVGAVVVFQDISERHAHARQLKQLATTDALTGLPNRRHFLEMVEQERIRHERYGEPAALLMLDLDHFKQINDNHGHAAGDAVLRSFAVSALHILRKSDHVGRLGGEEFAILLPDTDRTGAHEFADRLRHTVQEFPVDTASGPVSYSISVGVALFNRQDHHVDLLLARADHALYRAKHAGRNRVEMEEQLP